MTLDLLSEIRFFPRVAISFFSALKRDPQSLESITQKLSKQYTDVPLDTLKEDATSFFDALESDGFVASGNTFLECNEKDKRFSYNNSVNISRSISNSNLHKASKETQDFFHEFFNDEPQMTHLHMEITGKCNERCAHCYIPHEKKTESMSEDMFYDVLEQCRKMNVLHITISGGEPMLHNHFIDFIKKCNEYNFSVNILSNLTLLNQDMIDQMKRYPLLCVQTSLYSMNPETHDRITHMQGSFDQTVSSILKLLENDIPLQVSCPIMRQNLNDYKDVIAWCKDHQLQANSDYVIIGSYDHAMQNLDCRLSLDDIQEIMLNKAETDSEYLESITKEYDKKKSLSYNDYVCSVCQSSICISESGDVYPCAGWQSYVIGNIKDSPLSDIWFSSEKIKHLRNIRRADFPKCCDCSDSRFCTICMVRNANDSPQGNPMELSEFFCSIARLNRETYFRKVGHMEDNLSR